MANINANKTKNIYAPASSSYYYILEANFEETSTSTSNNTSTLTLTGKLTSHSINFGSGGGTLAIYWYDDNNNTEGTLIASSNITSIALNKSVSVSDTITVNHKSNGTLSGYAKAVWTKTSSNTYVPASNNVQTDDTELTAVAVAPSINFSIIRTEDKEVYIDFNSNIPVDNIAYSLNGGTSYNTIFSGSSLTSYQFWVYGLEGNTSYQIKLRARGSESQQYGYSSTISVTTLNIPYIKSVSKSNLKIGESQTLTIYNPLMRPLTIYMKKGNVSGTILFSENITGGGQNQNYTFTPSSNTLLNSLPSSNEDDVVYYCYNSYTGYKSDSVISGKYSLDNSQGIYNPTFDESNWSYSSTNYSSLTNDSSSVIKGKSTIDFSVDNAAIPATGATNSKYKIEWGLLNDYINSSTTGTGSLTGGTDNIIKVTAIDSRTNTKISQKTIDLIEYFAPTITASVEREDGIGINTLLDLYGTFFNNTFGNVGEQNVIQSAKYYVSTDNETWSTGYNIPLNNFTISDNNFSLSDFAVHADGTSGGFPVGIKYYIKVEISDSLESVILDGIFVTDGKIAQDVYQDSNGDYHIGINGLANSNYTEEIHGSLNVTDNIYINGEEIGNPIVDEYSTSTTKAYSANYVNGLFNLIYPVGAIYISTSSTNPGTLFGGTWEQIKDTFLLACGNTYSNGATGGSATNSHTHGYAHTHGVPGVAHTHGLSDGYALINHHDGYFYFKEKSVTTYAASGRGASTGANNTTNQTDGIGLGGSSNSATPNSATTNTQNKTTTDAPSDTNNMPPYLAVYVWKRTA